jgi:hypothetical protein
MTEGLAVALIAASSAVLGGLLSAFATRSVESMRLRAGLREKAEERKLAALQRFSKAAFAWAEWLNYIASDRVWDETVAAENNRRSRERQEAYRELVLLSSDELYMWLDEVYAPLEDEFNRRFGEPARRFAEITDEARKARSRYFDFLRRDLISRFRPEISALRNPDLGTVRVRRASALRSGNSSER